MKKTNWLIVGIVAVIALLFLFGGGMMSGWGYGGYGYHGWGMMGGPGGMMGGWGILSLRLDRHGFHVVDSSWYTCSHRFWRHYAGAKCWKSHAPIFTKSLFKCGKGVQADWQNCPYCGTALK